MSDENELWLEFESPRGLCGLCGNRGMIDTRGKVHSAAGIECGVLACCICLNGRGLKRHIDAIKAERGDDAARAELFAWRGMYP